MNPLVTLDEALVYPGQDTPRAELLADARAQLLAAGAHHLDVDDALTDSPGRVVRAWWGGDEVGFVNAEDPRAQPVAVVNLPRGLTRAKEARR